MTGRREVAQVAPDESSYKTRHRPSGPTIYLPPADKPKHNCAQERMHAVVGSLGDRTILSLDGNGD
jgi:hypothetical protein